MSAENSIVQGGREQVGREADPQAERLGFELPPEIMARYEVREVQSPDGADRRVGLFLPSDRQNPAIEIAGDRIMARNEDPETVATLVKIAQHNGWERIDVEGSPEFRKAVALAALREGIDVRGYEPSFVEREEMSRLRREAAARQAREAAERPQPAVQVDVGDATIPARSGTAVPGAVAREVSIGGAEGELSEGDRRLLLTLSRHTEDRKGLYENLSEKTDPFDREVQFERIDANREALDHALERALESPTLVKAFERSGYEPEALRQMGEGGEWDGEVADAIYLVRSGLNRDQVARSAEATAMVVDEIDAGREQRSVAVSIASQDRRSEPEPRPVQDHQREEAAGLRRESDELAELFLHGSAEKLAGDPRLANALQAQMTMEKHIGEVFEGDASRMASANLESRQMISDVLRRGLDVSVREPTQVRQIEPMQTRPDLER